ncbi:MAG: hypothetical protein GY869_15810 [Planctomycetes bacterium]|nr:hypothetical protein [Planctomycetota bacterium]
MGFLGLPMALLALASIPTLTAIYWLRNRFHRLEVSSLILWIDHKKPKEGGRRVQRIQTPLLFFLELLALLFMVAAAVHPMIPSSSTLRQYVMILDDSYSMNAGGDSSARQKGIEAIIEELDGQNNFSVRFILARDEPWVLGSTARSLDEVRQILTPEENDQNNSPVNWQCLAMQADIAKAVLLAEDLVIGDYNILVVTDHTPIQSPTENSDIQWWAFGETRANAAFVNAARTIVDQQERCLLEIANLSNEPTQAQLVIEGLDTPAGSNPENPPARYHQQNLTLAADSIKRVILNLKDKTPAFRAQLTQLTGDGLVIDNNVILLPAHFEPAPVALSIADESLRNYLTEALEATKQARIINLSDALLSTTDRQDRAQIVFTDSVDFNINDAKTWIMRITVPTETDAYVGPFVMDRSHPLLEGLALEGVIWSASKVKPPPKITDETTTNPENPPETTTPPADNMPGRLVILAGNTPLITYNKKVNGQHRIYMELAPELSTLQDSVSWPILISNVLRWRSSENPGPRQLNIPMATDATIKLHRNTQKVDIGYPDGRIETAVQFDSMDKIITIPADLPGKYLVKTEYAVGEETQQRTEELDWEFASNVLHKEESDLRNTLTQRWGDWRTTETMVRAYHDIGWLFLLLALAVLIGHLALVGGMQLFKKPDDTPTAGV